MRKKEILMLTIVSVFLLVFCPGAKAEAEAEELLINITYSLPRAGEAAIDEKIQKALKDTELEADSPEAEELAEEALPPLKGSLGIAVVGEPNKGILEAAVPLMREEGYELEIISCEDYDSPNTLLLEGKADGNLFQHLAYLDRYNQHKDVELTSLGRVYYEPLGIYPGKCKTLEEIPERARIGVPDNPTGYAQALLLLQQEGLLTLMEDADLTAIWEDVTDNPLELELVPLKEEELAASLEELDLAVFHGSYALWQQLSPTRALAMEAETSLAAQQLSQVLVTEGSAENPAESEEETKNGAAEGLTVLLNVLKSEEMQEYVNRQYRGSIVIME